MKMGKKLDGKYANAIACLSTYDIFDKKGNKLKGLCIKSNQVQDKLSDDRFGRWR